MSYNSYNKTNWCVVSFCGLLIVGLCLAMYITGGITYPIVVNKYSEIKYNITHVFSKDTVYIVNDNVDALEFRGTIEIPGGFSMLDPKMQRLVVIIEQEKIPMRITSGYRHAGVAGNAGAASYHCKGLAIDIAPLRNNPDFAYLRYRLKTNKRLRDYMIANEIGVYEEIDGETMGNTGATGKHFHISPGEAPMKFWTDEINNIN